MTSSAQLQREAEAARIGLADPLGQLRDGVTPSALSTEAISLFKESSLSIVKALAEQARANPVPALLIGAGLTMLLTGTKGSDVVGVASSTLKSAAASSAEVVRGAASTVASAAVGAASVAKDAVTGAAVPTKDSLQGSVDQGKDALDASRQGLGDMAGQLSGQAQTLAQEARQSFARLIEEQPILMAALGAALGAAVGAALPLSRAEKDLLGQTAANALEAGREALSGRANLVRQEVASAEIGARIEIADKVVRNVTKEICNPMRP
jgi:hypothetical protein